jgi:protein phosphatase
MSNTPPDPPGQPGGWTSGFKGLFQSARAGEDSGSEEVLPAAIPIATPVSPDDVGAATALPVATPVEAVPLAAPVPLAQPVESSPPALDYTPPLDTDVAALDEQVPEAAPAAPTTMACPSCGTVSPLADAFCGDCGYYFSAADRAAACPAGAATAPPAAAPSAPAPLRVGERYELLEKVSERLGVERFRARDHGEGGRAVPVTVIRQPLPPSAAPAEPAMFAEPVPLDPPTEADGDLQAALDEDLFDELLPVFPATEVMTGQQTWPSLGWERRLLRTLESKVLPAERAYFADDTHEYLVLEVPTGQLLWDAWDDPDGDSRIKFGYLVEVAEILHRLHQGGAMLEGLRPDIVVIDDTGHIRLTDLADLLPIHVPLGAPVRGTLYSAPELLSAQGAADARADLYSFGAMLYALHVGRELNERTDFDGPGNPKPFIPRFPDIHPSFGRLMMKTFRKEVEARFPTDEACKEDPTGFVELARTLETLRRTYDNVRLEIASWTSTGIVRTGNEDAFAVLHATESRQDDLGEAALVILCDGMGGYEAGEVAAALCIQKLRQHLSQLRPFSVAAGASPFATDPLTHMSRPEGHAAADVDVDAVKQAIRAALRDANKFVFQTSRAPGSKRRGMGCTAEVVYVDGRNVIVGHVGDSRTYHLHEGRMIQLTRDQTLVNRLVELGSLTPEEAETHPRRNELQQAIGGQPDVDPGLYHGRMSPGDWVLVCSDGLTNHVNASDLQQMLQSEAVSAEMAARRLVNLTLIEGATDNVTVVVLRAT